ncbi:MAG TPA: DUF6289 family protein [Candidatus Polarisedimenticolaceae bacterium]|nr:DUF6289 family protein [Candidatus Polarisedimenticolaceae bacterium]
MKGTRSLIAAVALGIGIVAFVTTLPGSQAGTSVCTYYSDATHKKAVGARGTGCCGSVINWGVTSSYKVCQTIYCTDQICPN